MYNSTSSSSYNTTTPRLPTTSYTSDTSKSPSSLGSVSSSIQDTTAATTANESSYPHYQATSTYDAKSLIYPLSTPSYQPYSGVYSSAATDATYQQSSSYLTTATSFQHSPYALVGQTTTTTNQYW